MNNIIKEFWDEFLSKTNRDLNTKYIECDHFEVTEKWANELLRLVLIGQKKATSGLLADYTLNNARVPKVGDLSIITNWDNIPFCVVETQNVTIIPFKDIDFSIASREGEDLDLDSWKRGHIKFYKSQCLELGIEFNESLEVVFEDFKVIYRKEN